jgi:hypothetical protein
VVFVFIFCWGYIVLRLQSKATVDELRLLSGIIPDFLSTRSLMPYQGFDAGGLAVPSNFPSGTMQRFGIRVAEFELDMRAVALDRSATDAKLFRDLTGAVSSRDE